MKAFLSWSGQKSHKMALAFSEWIPCVIQAVEPWVSSKDIDRGSIWFTEIFDHLNDTNLGIVFVTRENQNKPWLLFESGALSKGLTENRVCTVLVDLNVRDIEASSPLSHLNHTTVDKDSVLKLIKTINKKLDDNQVKETHLERSFNALWSELETKIQSILDEDPVQEENIRQDEDVLNDILDNVLTINKKISQGGRDRHRDVIEARHAEKLLDRLLKMDLERGDIEEAMEDIVPSPWVRKKLDEIFGRENDDE